MNSIQRLSTTVSLVLVHSSNEQKMIRNKSQELEVSDPKLLCVTFSQGFNSSSKHKVVHTVNVRMVPADTQGDLQHHEPNTH